MAARDKRIHCVRFVRNFGQTAALAAGIDFANGDIIIPMDADLQNDPVDITRLLAKLDEGFDVVSGWRKDRQDEYFTRLIPAGVPTNHFSYKWSSLARLRLLVESLPSRSDQRRSSLWRNASLRPNLRQLDGRQGHGNSSDSPRTSIRCVQVRLVENFQSRA